MNKVFDFFFEKKCNILLKCQLFDQNLTGIIQRRFLLEYELFKFTKKDLSYFNSSREIDKSVVFKQAIEDLCLFRTIILKKVKLVTSVLGEI